MEYPPELKPTHCIRCGHDIQYQMQRVKIEPDSNDLVIPVVCLNERCGITFKVLYKFDKWEYF